MNLPLILLPQFSFGLLLVGSLAIVLVRPAAGVCIHAGLFVAACVLDQTRIQPQVISLIVLMAACAHREGTWFARWYLVAMWFWSGLHKLLSNEWLGWGSWSFLEACGIDGDRWHLHFALAAAGGEILLAMAAVFWPRRAASGCVMLHLGILLALIVRNHNPSVWPWNLATAVVGAWILWQPVASVAPRLERLRQGLAIALFILPAAYYVNLLNPHLAFVLYSGNMPLAYHTTPTQVSELGGWHGLTVPFPDSPRLYLQAFRQKAAAGDKLAIIDPRLGQPDRYYVMTSGGWVEEILRERFLTAGSGEVEGIELAHPASVWRVERLGISLEFAENRLETSAVASGPRISDRALQELASLPNLQQVEIEDAAITDDGLAHLLDLHRLEILRIRRCNITDKGLRHLAGLSRLRGLELQETQVTSAGLEILDRWPELKVLQLPGAPIDAACLARIGKLQKLEWLDLSGTNISSAGLASLTTLQNCTWISLARTAVDDQGLPHLSRLPNLQVIELAGTKISDAGLVSLQSLTKLEYLNLREAAVSEAGAAKLQKLLPACQVVR